MLHRNELLLLDEAALVAGSLLGVDLPHLMGPQKGRTGDDAESADCVARAHSPQTGSAGQTGAGKRAGRGGGLHAS